MQSVFRSTSGAVLLFLYREGHRYITRLNLVVFLFFVLQLSNFTFFPLKPVKEYRLEDALEVTGHLVREGSDNAKKSARGGQKDEEMLSKTALKRMYQGYNKNVIDSLAVVDEAVINYELIAELLEYICTLEEGECL